MTLARFAAPRRSQHAPNASLQVLSFQPWHWVIGGGVSSVPRFERSSLDKLQEVTSRVVLGLRDAPTVEHLELFCVDLPTDETLLHIRAATAPHLDTLRIVDAWNKPLRWQDAPPGELNQFDVMCESMPPPGKLELVSISSTGFARPQCCIDDASMCVVIRSRA